MAFSPVPQESRKQINKAGQILVSQKPSREEFLWAWDLANK
jgi:hypothetical protein